MKEAEKKSPKFEKQTSLPVFLGEKQKVRDSLNTSDTLTMRSFEAEENQELRHSILKLRKEQARKKKTEEKKVQFNNVPEVIRVCSYKRFNSEERKFCICAIF